MALTRRAFGASAAALAALPAATARPFAPTWNSLRAGFTVPDWFADAKFGIWAHWGPQCVPMKGDWYARLMYIQGQPKYAHHLAHYGHPSRNGYIDLIDRWRAERWEPGQLLDLYQRAGARYFMALACHHDNVDTFASTHHAWNATRIGPRRDIVGTWEKLVRDRGMRFGLSNHGAHAWHWYQPAYGYDQEGPLAGVRYDAYRLTAADGADKPWAGLDPQALYTGRSMVLPDGITSMAAARAWRDTHDGQWLETPPADPRFAALWRARAIDSIDHYQPDLFYLDDTGDLPLGQAGLDVTAHLYNASVARHGRLEAAVTIKGLPPEKAGVGIDDVERGFIADIAPQPWQSDTCLGDWFYDEELFLQHRYKSASSVIQRLCDAVSKNGALLLNVPQRPDGTIDEDEHAIVSAIGDWMAVNGEAIFGTRPAPVFGEGPTTVGVGKFGESATRPFTAADIRYTQKGAIRYALVLGTPAEPRVRLTRLGGLRVGRVELLGTRGSLPFRTGDGAVEVSLPPNLPASPALALRLSPA